MRALFLFAAVISTALSGCVRCCVPLNAPPYDPTQWGWGPQDRFCVTRSYYGFAKDYPGVRPYRMLPPGAPAPVAYPAPVFHACGPVYAPVCPVPPPMAVGPSGMADASVTAGPSVAGAPAAVAF
jgi:hypothetical protein